MQRRQSPRHHFGAVALPGERREAQPEHGSVDFGLRVSHHLGWQRHAARPLLGCILGLVLACNPGRRHDKGQAAASASTAPLPPPEPEAPSIPVYPPYLQNELLPAPQTPIEFVQGLEHYYRRLTLVDMGVQGTLARAGHWGDSIIAADRLTSKIRARLQKRFGDGGHGFHVLGRYNLGYQHEGIKFRSSHWNNCLMIFKCRRDGHYGYGGVVSDSNGGSVSSWTTVEEGFGSRVSRFELWYASQPRGGKAAIFVDDEEVRVLDTKAEQLIDSWELIQVEDGAHRFKVKAQGQGAFRGYGVVLEREGPGAVWDELTIIGSFTQRLDYFDAAHLQRQLERRQIDLMVFLLGGNDTQRNRLDLRSDRPMTPYIEEFTTVIRKFRKARPLASCLVMAVTDHADEVEPGLKRARAVGARMAQVQREVAAREGCAFFDTFTAMGGEGAIIEWARRRPAWANGDLRHLAEPGHEEVARMLYEALLTGYADFRNAHEGKPFPELQQASQPSSLLHTSVADAAVSDAEQR